MAPAQEPTRELQQLLPGPDPEAWRTHVPHWSEVVYTEAWPGVDLVLFFDENGRLEYDLRVKPGADPEAITLTYRGLDRVVRSGGHMVLRGGERSWVDDELFVYQDTPKGRVAVASVFDTRGATSYGVAVLGPYDRAQTLVIDPTYSIGFATYWGSGGANNRTVAIDLDGNIYMSGGSSQTDWPTTTGAYDQTHAGNGWPDATVAKFDPDGNLLWSTLLGGSEEDYVYVSAVDDAGELYVSGRSGTGFPTTSGAFDESFNGGSYSGSVHSPVDAFVTKLTTDGDDLVYSTYLGGNGNDNGRAIHLLPTGELLVGGGNSSSNNLPATPGALREALGGAKDSWVAKLSDDGSDVAFFTYIGPTDDTGNGDETVRALGEDSAGNVWIGGTTSGTNLTATSDAFQSTRGQGADSFIAKISGDGSTLVYFSWLGGSKNEGIETEGVSDADGNFYVAGGTGSPDFPVSSGAFQSTLKGGGGQWDGDGFVARINDDGSLGFATLYGGSTVGAESFFGPVVDKDSNVYASGRFRSDDLYVTSDAYEGTKLGTAGTHDAVLVVFNPDGTDVLYATYFGGSGVDMGRLLGIHPDSSAAYLIGETNSTDIPMVDAYQTTPAAAYLAKFDIEWADTDTDTDTDSDTDTDADTDSDTDSDADTDTDADTDSGPRFRRPR